MLTLIGETPRLKMAVRGWIAEEHLVVSPRIPGVTDCARLTTEGSPDVTLRFQGSKPLTIECKNVLRKMTREGLPRLDFQRTRALAKGRPLLSVLPRWRFLILRRRVRARGD